MKQDESEKSPDGPVVTIRISDLVDVFEQLCRYMVESGRDSVVIPHDYYWNIDPSERYNPMQTPTMMSLGRLTDDWEELVQILNGEKESLGYAFVWLAHVVEAIGESNVG